MKEFENEETKKVSEGNEEKQNPQKLSLKELLAVQGGLDFDDYMGDCNTVQCISGAVHCEIHA